MSMVVQHNMQAANANRMLGITSGAQAKSTEKLSSGYKINVQQMMQQDLPFREDEKADPWIGQGIF